MTNAKWKVDGYVCKSEDDYQATLRDAKRIHELKEKFDIEDENQLRELYSALQTEQISFESALGWDFDDMVYEKFQKYLEKRQSRETAKRDSMQLKHDTSKNKTKSNSDRKNVFAQKAKAKDRVSLNDYDNDMQKRILAEYKKNEDRRRLIFTICTLIAVVCFAYTGTYYFMSVRNQREAQRLADLVKEEYVTPSPYVGAENREPSEAEVYVEPQIMEKYEDLYNQNKSLIGWIKIADTNIDYPVMQTVNNEYYLTYNFNQEYDRNGSIFLDMNCCVSPRSMNLIIYGHHMKSGKMFGKLSSYESESYYKEHPIILFDSIYEEGMYQVMYVFRDKVYSEQDVNFKYYQFVDAYSEEEFESYMNEMQERSFYDTKVTATYGDQLLTLSTCDYEQTDGRFVVVAKRIWSENEIVQ